MTNHTTVTKKAREIAREHGLKARSRKSIVAAMRKIRTELLRANKPDYCKVVADRLNEMGLFKGYYRNGSLEFTRFDVRDAWFDYYGEPWSEGVFRLRLSNPVKRTKKAKPGKRVKKKKKKKLGWWNTPGYISKAAQEFGESQGSWVPATREEIIEMVTATKPNKAVTSAEMAAILNHKGVLRPNYRNGSPQWSGDTLIGWLSSYTGKTFKEIRKEAADKNQGKLPLEQKQVPNRTVVNAQLLSLDATKKVAQVKITRLITQTETVKYPTDHRIVRELLRGMANQKTDTSPVT